jgi:hypothetical protein
MDVLHARRIARRLHAGDREADGRPLLDHIWRVARRVPVDARVVACLHEALTWSAVAEDHLLMEGLESEELRALRLLDRVHDARSEHVYLAHLHLIANAAGEAGRMARIVKIADLQDRRVHPLRRADGWSPPYGRGLDLLTGQLDPRPGAGRVAAA